MGEVGGADGDDSVDDNVNRVAEMTASRAVLIL